jgi:hypothetical protein
MILLSSGTHDSFFNASRTSFWSGSDRAGLVQAIHTILITPERTASNISTALLPGAAGTRLADLMRGQVQVDDGSVFRSPPTTTGSGLDNTATAMRLIRRTSERP